MTAPELLHSNKQTVHIKARLRSMFVTTDTVMIQNPLSLSYPFCAYGQEEYENSPKEDQKQRETALIMCNNAWEMMSACCLLLAPHHLMRTGIHKSSSSALLEQPSWLSSDLFPVFAVSVLASRDFSEQQYVISPFLCMDPSSLLWTLLCMEDVTPSQGDLSYRGAPAQPAHTPIKMTLNSRG